MVSSDLCAAPARIAVILSAVYGWRWPCLAAIALPALVLEDDDLLAQALLDDLRLDRDALDGRLADLDVAAVVGEQQRSEGHLRTRLPASFSTRRVSPSATRYCFPPDAMTAYMNQVPRWKRRSLESEAPLSSEGPVGPPLCGRP